MKFAALVGGGDGDNLLLAPSGASDLMEKYDRVHGQTTSLSDKRVARSSRLAFLTQSNSNGELSISFRDKSEKFILTVSEDTGK